MESCVLAAARKILTPEEAQRRARQRRDILALGRPDRQMLKSLAPKRKVRLRCRTRFVSL